MKSLFYTLVTAAALTAGTTSAAAETRTPENTHIFSQAYNVIYANNLNRIFKESSLFLCQNPGLMAIAVNPFFWNKIVANLKNKVPIQGYLETFDAYDPSERIKNFALHLTTTGKDENAAGVAALRALIKDGYKVTLLIGQPAETIELLKKQFPILNEVSDIEVNFEGSPETFAALRKTTDKEHAVLITGNTHRESVMHRESVAYAKEAGITAQLFTQPIN